jgi:hypothetical protein
MRVRSKDNQGERMAKKNAGIPPNRNQTHHSRRHLPFLSTLSAARSCVSGPRKSTPLSNRLAASRTSIFQVTDPPILVLGCFAHLHLGNCPGKDD